ncbi:hypothetical protein BaRGS_00007130 [Batillaria attramentaria]|uniref:TIR domain-containing protein n=1 Tax=Batillaria attramentaria TaxID=370345 RepID=A0ABD0LRR5_9CAEN
MVTWFLAPLVFATLGTIPAATSTCTFVMQSEGTYAYCSHKHLTVLPKAWPADVVWLDLSYNQLTNVALTEMAQPHLSHLRHLDLSYNHLQGTVKNNTFLAFEELEWLSVHGNRLAGLEADAMSGLEKLVFLDMSYNRLQLTRQTYPLGVLDPLTSLQQLYLYGNDDRFNGEYPEGMFRTLSNLRTLSIDTFARGTFGTSFLALPRLRSLLIVDKAKIKVLTNSTLNVFKNSSLEEIDTGTDLLDVEVCAFCDLPQLKILRIMSAIVPLSSCLEALYGLQHHNMSEIALTNSLNVGRPVTIDRHSFRYLRNICVKKLNLADSEIQRVKSSAFGSPEDSLYQCIQELDLSKNRILGDKIAIFLTFSFFKNLIRLRLDGQKIFSLGEASHRLGHNRDHAKDRDVDHNHWTFRIPPNLRILNCSAAFGKIGLMPGVLDFIPRDALQTLDLSYCRFHNCLTTFVPLTSLETLSLSGNDCYNISEAIFDNLPVLRELRLSNFNLNPEFFRTHARRLFQNLLLLQTLDLSLNNLIHVDLNMLRSSRHLKELNMAGNRLQSLPLDLTLHEELEVIDLTNNMLTTLEQHERQVLDKLTGKHNLTLHLGGNPLLCVCSNLDFVRWLWSTEVQLDGDGRDSRTFTCVTESGEVSDTHSVLVQYDTHWRRCVGQQVLGVTTAAFLLLLLALVIVYVVSRSWTHLRYVWKVMQRLRLPRRENFRRDAYVGYADADWEFACVTLPACLQERHGVRLLLRDFEEVPGSIRAENIVQHIDDSWKVVLLVTRAFATDEWLCGFTVQQAQRSIMDTMPDRVLVVFMEDPARLPPMASLERLLRMVPEKNMVHVRRDTPVDDPVWDRLARDILDRKRRDEYYASP